MMSSIDLMGSEVCSGARGVEVSSTAGEMRPALNFMSFCWRVATLMARPVLLKSSTMMLMGQLPFLSS